jgi:hypothetical protein
VTFCYRGDEVAAQAMSGAVRYDISHDPARGRWYIDASWTAAPAPAASLDELRQHPVVAVDVNHGHLAAAAVIAPDGNIPTARLRDRLVQMACNAGLSVIVIDPAYTSLWGTGHWLRPLREHHPQATGHHAAALVIGRRGLGHRARRRTTGNHTAPEEAARPAQARPRTTPARGTASRKPAAPPGLRQPPGTKTGRPHRTTAGTQAAQERSGPPAGQDYVLLVQ